jgi:hypothetical protein
MAKDTRPRLAHKSRAAQPTHWAAIRSIAEKIDCTAEM